MKLCAFRVARYTQKFCFSFLFLIYYNSIPNRMLQYLNILKIIWLCLERFGYSMTSGKSYLISRWLQIHSLESVNFHFVKKFAFPCTIGVLFLSDYKVKAPWPPSTRWKINSSSSLCCLSTSRRLSYFFSSLFSRLNGYSLFFFF